MPPSGWQWRCFLRHESGPSPDGLWILRATCAHNAVGFRKSSFTALGPLRNRTVQCLLLFGLPVRSLSTSPQLILLPQL